MSRVQTTINPSGHRLLANLQAGSTVEITYPSGYQQIAEVTSVQPWNNGFVATHVDDDHDTVYPHCLPDRRAQGYSYQIIDQRGDDQ